MIIENEGGISKYALLISKIVMLANKQSYYVIHVLYET